MTDWDSDGARKYALNLLHLGSVRIMTPEAGVAVARWIAALRAELSAIHATTDWQRWARAVTGWELARAEVEGAEAALARVKAAIGGMHEDWCRGKHDAERECECIRAEVLAALAGPGATT